MLIPEDIERVAGLGWHVFPCSRLSRAMLFKGAHLAAACCLDQIARWCGDYDRPNWRVLFGRSGLWGLDLDVPPGHADDGIAGLAALVRVHGPLPPRPQARSGGGGLGLYFRHQGERIIGHGGVPAPGIDPRRGMQTQTIPPSIHTGTSQPYRWVTPPWEVAPPAAPGWLLRLVEPPPEPAWRQVEADTHGRANQRLLGAIRAVMTAAEGDRNNCLNRRSYQMGHLVAAGLLGERQAAEALNGAARQAGLDPLECAATIRSGLRSGMRAGHAHG